MSSSIITKRVLFMGTPFYAKQILNELSNHSWIEIVGVVTQPDKKSGRDMKLSQSDVKVFALEKEFKILQPEKLKNNSEIVNEIKKLKPDFLVVAAYGQILPKEILNIAPAINLHASILPKYRGASPIQEALLNGDLETGITAMLMNEGLDTGDILAISRIQLEKSYIPNQNSLTIELSSVASYLIIDVLANFHLIKPLSQHSADSSYCKKIEKIDGLVSFTNCRELLNKSRAFIYWPSAYLNNGLKLIIVAEGREGNFNEGEILEINEHYIEVGCKDMSIKIFSVQPPSKYLMNARAYINGKRYKLGEIFK